MARKRSAADYLWNTNIAEVTKELADEALKSVKSLKSAINDLEEALKNRKSRDSVCYGWISNADEHFTSIKNNISRINGAVLVRGTEKPEE